jgi:hypothetical protein
MDVTARFLILLLLVGGVACAPQKIKDDEIASVKINVPTFNSDSAYFFVERQVKFGPRVPNSKPHRDAAAFLINRLKSYGAVVVEQDFQAFTFDHQQLKLKNIIASFFPEATKRIVLAAHWDTRPFADKDDKNKNASLRIILLQVDSNQFTLGNFIYQWLFHHFSFTCKIKEFM